MLSCCSTDKTGSCDVSTHAPSLFFEFSASEMMEHNCVVKTSLNFSFAPVCISLRKTPTWLAEMTLRNLQANSINHRSHLHWPCVKRNCGYPKEFIFWLIRLYFQLFLPLIRPRLSSERKRRAKTPTALVWLRDVIAAHASLVPNWRARRERGTRNKQTLNRRRLRQLCNCPELPERSREAFLHRRRALSQLALARSQLSLDNAEWEEIVFRCLVPVLDLWLWRSICGISSLSTHDVLIYYVSFESN